MNEIRFDLATEGGRRAWEQWIALLVLARAVRDVAREPDADEFLFGPAAWLEAVCRIAGVDPEALRQRARHMVEKRGGAVMAPPAAVAPSGRAAPSRCKAASRGM